MQGMGVLIVLGSLVITGSACTPMGGPAFDRTPEPVETPDTLADLTLPDFRITKMTWQLRGHRPYWHVEIWVENIGGNKGLLEEPTPTDDGPRVAAEMRVKLDVLTCQHPDGGQEGFECVNARQVSLQPRMVVPLAGQERRLTRDYDNYSLGPYRVWQIWAMADATRDEQAVVEKDSPARWNNQALLKIVRDPERSSFDPATRTWTWPNDEDSLPF
jgi:hypothetical protein